MSSSEVDQPEPGRVEALHTFIEQTKLLVSLASGFVLAPPAVLSFLRRPDAKATSPLPWGRFMCAEALLVLSILAGFVVLGTVAGSQYDGSFDVYRSASRFCSLCQLFLYLAGIAMFLSMIPALI
jgi:hypothetical protein